MNGGLDSELALGQAGVQALQVRAEEEEKKEEDGVKKAVIDKMAVVAVTTVLAEVPAVELEEELV